MSLYIESNFFDVVNHGKFFFPAWKHYGNPDADVRCDRCFKTNLKSSIGYQNKDLCLDCTDIVCSKNVVHLPVPVIFEPQQIPQIYPPFGQQIGQPLRPRFDPYNPFDDSKHLTFMVQDIYKPKQFLTNMEQNFFKH